MIREEKEREIKKSNKTQAVGQKEDSMDGRLPHAVRPLSWSELPVDAGGYRGAKIKY
jgi:hypothetical protein